MCGRGGWGGGAVERGRRLHEAEAAAPAPVRCRRAPWVSRDQDQGPRIGYSTALQGPRFLTLMFEGARDSTRRSRVLSRAPENISGKNRGPGEQCCNPHPALKIAPRVAPPSQNHQPRPRVSQDQDRPAQRPAQPCHPAPPPVQPSASKAATAATSAGSAGSTPGPHLRMVGRCHGHARAPQARKFTIS